MSPSPRCVVFALLFAAPFWVLLAAVVWAMS